MELKDVFGEIEADGANLVHGRLLEWALTPPLWHAEAVGGRPHHQAPMRARSAGRPMSAIHFLPALLALALTQSAAARCQDAPRPRVDWAGCSRNLLMLGGDDLTEAVFSRATLTSTDFRRSKLARAKLTEAELSFTRFEEADLSGADLSKAVGWKANFARANLDHANLSGADLSRAIFVDAKIAGAKFSKSEMNRADFSRADLTGADLSKAGVARAVFTDAKLSGVRFTYADLARANLKELDLAGIDFAGAYLFQARLEGADLSRAVGLTQDQLALACGTHETKLPARMVQPDTWPCPPEND